MIEIGRRRDSRASRDCRNFNGRHKKDKLFYDKYDREHGLARIAWKLRNPREAQFINRILAMHKTIMKELREVE